MLTAVDESGIRSDRFSDDACQRRYYLVCLCCGSRLEVTTALAGRSANCPTCGITFEVPDLATLAASDHQVLEVGQPPNERAAVHAYAAAGAMAPEVVTDDSGASMIRCRRCGTMNPIDANSCRSCGMPFTVEAGTGISVGPWRGWTVVSLVLGILALITYPVPLLAVAAIATGLVAVKSLYIQYDGVQKAAAWSGVALGLLALAAFAAGYISRLLVLKFRSSNPF